MHFKGTIVLVEPEGKYLKSYHEAYLEYETNNINNYHFSDGDGYYWYLSLMRWCHDDSN